MPAATTRTARVPTGTTDPDQLNIDRRGAWSLGLIMFAGIVISAFRARWRHCAAFTVGELIFAGAITIPDPDTVPGRRRGTR